MADDAEDLLDMSKENKGKNSISIFGVTVKWEEFEELLKLVKIIDYFLDNGMKMSYLYRILKFIEMAEELKRGKLTIKNIRNCMWIPLLRYLTIRNYSKNSFLMENLSPFFVKNIQKYGEKLIIPISLSIYKRRK